MQSTSILGASLALCLMNASASAHHPGGVGGSGGSGAINTLSASTLDQGQQAAAVVYSGVWIRSFSDARLLEIASTKHTHVHTLSSVTSPSLVYAYGLTNDITVSARLPYVMRKDIRAGEHVHLHGGGSRNFVEGLGDTDGIGDLSALVQWRFFKDKTAGVEWALLAGIEAPTGKTTSRKPNGTLHDLDHQPGSGSWDYMIGIAHTTSLGRWAVTANALYKFTSTGEQRTDLGDQFTYNLALSYRLFGGAQAVSASSAMRLGALPEPMYHGAGRQSAKPSHQHVEPKQSPMEPQLDLVLELNGEWHAKQIAPHDGSGPVVDPNSGGNVVYLSPGVRLSQGAWTAFASAGTPIISNVNGYQPEPGYRVTTGVGVRF